MRFVDVKRIALYYKAIPGMLHLLRQERAELEEEYNGLGSTAADGPPHGSSPGKPTEELGLRALEDGTGERLAQIAEQERELLEDQAVIRGCLDGLNSKYKQLVLMRYVRGYSWAKIGVRLGTPDSTARSWHERAMERLSLSARAYDRILKAARTIADLAGRADSVQTDIAEAINYRSLDRGNWGR